MQAILIEKKDESFYFDGDGGYYSWIKAAIDGREWFYVKSKGPLTSDLTIIKPTGYPHIYEEVDESELPGTVPGETPAVCPQ